MEGITIGTVAQHFSVNLCPSLQSMLSFLQHQNACPLSHHEAGTLLIEGDGASADFGSRRKSLHTGKSAYSQFGNGGLGSSANHSSFVTVSDSMEGISDGIGAPCTGSYRANAHSL